MTDAERLLRHMKRGGEVCPTDWSRLDPIDGGKPIMRVAARICDLRAQGHHIKRIGTRNACAVYAMVIVTSIRKAA